MRLENWSVVNRNYDPHKTPEQQVNCLRGNVFGHPRFADGELVETSRIVKKNKDRIVTYSGSFYELGKIDSNYESLYLDARKRLFDSLAEDAK